MDARLKFPLLFFLLVWSALIPCSAAEPFHNTNYTTVQVDMYSDSSPALDTNGVIYLATWQGHVIALTTNLIRLWTYRTAFEMRSSPAIADDGTIYVGCRDRHLYALTSDGKKKWTFKTGAWVDSSPGIALDGTIYFGSWDSKFYALNPDGQKKWEFKTGAPIDSSPAIALDGTIYFGSHDKNLYALNPDGTKRWQFPTGGQIISSPSIGPEGEIYFSSVDGNLYALNSDGKKRWVTHTGGTTESSPVIGPNGNIYLGVNSNYCAFSGQGKQLWQFTIWQYYPHHFVRGTGAIGADGLSYFGADDHRFWAIGPDGIWRWLTWLAGPSVSAPVFSPDGTVYVQNVTYNFFAIKGASPPAKTSWPMFRADAQHTGRVQKIP